MKIFTLGVFNNNDISPFLAEKIVLTNTFTAYIFAAFTYYFFTYWFLEQKILALGMFLGMTSLLAVFWANSKFRFLVSRHILMITCNLAISLSDIYFHQRINAETYFLPASLIGFLVYDISEHKFIAFGTFWPLALWFIPRMLGFEFTSHSPELNPTQFGFLYYSNFFGAYAITAILVYTFFYSLVDFQKRLIVSNKFVALGEMSGGIAHEINNPLAVILGKASVLQRKLRSGNVSSEDLINDLKKIEHTAERISKIVRGLKNFSRSGEMDPMVPTPIAEILEDVLNLCQDKLNHHGVRLIAPDKIDCHINCRQHEIAQVVLNLLNNSADALDSLAKSSIETMDLWIKLDIHQTHDRVHISITDCGPGIPPAIAKKIMEPFFTTKAVGKGTGLGLSISKGIIEAHQGHFMYDSESKNTRFVVDLPKYSGTA